MKIDAFSLDFDSSRTFTQTRTQTVEVSGSNTFGSILNERSPEDILQDSGGDNSRKNKMSDFIQTDTPLSTAWQNVGEASLSEQFKAELINLRQIAHDMVEQFTARIGNTVSARLKKLNQAYTGQVTSSDFNILTQWEQTRTTTFTYEETEKVSVSAQGTVHTADDRQIDFSMDLLMERQYVSQTSTSVTETGYALIDPLVIQTGAQTPMLHGAQFSFDLDGDGQTEDLAGLSDGYAFLALDLNQDGMINDGTELFGPSTGNGFQELSDYDEDHNMWIDENDEMFDQFVLWNPSSDATRLTRLKDADIGAIYLGEVSSLFSLSSQDQQMAGQLTDTSFALTESGGMMPVYEMDYKV